VIFGTDLHAGDQAQLPALALEVAAAQGDYCAISRLLNRFDSRVARLQFFLRIAAHRNPPVTRTKLELQKIEPIPFNH
jgi:hypothetical protein